MLLAFAQSRRVFDSSEDRSLRGRGGHLACDGSKKGVTLLLDNTRAWAQTFFKVGVVVPSG